MLLVFQYAYNLMKTSNKMTSEILIQYLGQEPPSHLKSHETNQTTQEQQQLKSSLRCYCYMAHTYSSS